VKLKIPFPAQAQFDVVGMGLNAVDHLCVVPHYPQFDSKVKMLEYSKQGGGQVATAMVTCVRLGLKAKYIGKVGDDEFGGFSLESLKREGVDVSEVMVEKGAYSQFAFILIENGTGERTIIWDRDDTLKIHLHEGSLALYDGETFKTPAFRVECKDTTGAGDVFHGAFIYGMLQNWEIEEILRFSHAAASLKCRSLGGRSGIPSIPEIMKFIDSTGRASGAG
jgi:sugar/nucleoside kinase (ribokinase family)